MHAVFATTALLFCCMGDSGDLVPVWGNIRLRRALLREVQAAAAAEGRSATSWVEMRLRRVLDAGPAGSRLLGELREDPGVLAELARMLADVPRAPGESQERSGAVNLRET